MSVERGGFEGLSVLQCVKAVSEATDVSLIDILSDRQTRTLARSRQLAMWLARKATFRSLPEIGRMMRRDHTSVLYGVSAIEKLRAEDPQMKALSDRLLEKCRPRLS